MKVLICGGDPLLSYLFPRFFLTLALGGFLLLHVSEASLAQELGDGEQSESEQSGNKTGDGIVYGGQGNKGGLFLGVNTAFGQGRSTQSGSSPGLAFLLGIEPGYRMGRGSFSRVQFSGKLFFGNLSYRLSDAEGGTVNLPIGFGLLAKAGYGYSLGENLFGVMSVGVGPVMAKYSAKPLGTKVESPQPFSGIVYGVSYMFVFPAGSSLDLTGGVSYNQMQFNIDEVEDAQGTSYKADAFNVNLLQAEMGLSYRL